MTHPSNSIGRRGFIKASSGAITALAASGAYAANDTINAALIGCGGRGRLNVRGMREAGAQITHLCDLNLSEAEKTAEFMADVQKDKPKLVRRIEEVLADDTVDVVIVATPDHWHTPLAIQACKAGKDVYVEKPHAHNIWESRQLVTAAKKYGRIVQAGTQNRSGAYNFAARDYIRSGKLGEIGLAKVYNLKSGGPFKMGEPGKMPKGFDWNEWLGATAERPWHQRLYNGGWHKYWAYSGGDLADDGIHQLDLALMLLGDPGMPKGITCIGGRYIHGGDDAEVPDTQSAAFDFGNLVLTLEMTNYPRYMEKTTHTIRRKDAYPYWTQNATRIELYGSELMMTIGRHGGGWQVTTSGGRVVDQMYGRPCDDEHYGNFLACVRNRKASNAAVAIAHHACSMVHMANTAHRAGNTGLAFDAKKEHYVNNRRANHLLKDDYRPGYEIKV